MNPREYLIRAFKDGTITLVELCDGINRLECMTEDEYKISEAYAKLGILLMDYTYGAVIK